MMLSTEEPCLRGVDVIHLVIKHPNYLTIPLLTQKGGGYVIERLENMRQHVVINSTWVGLNSTPQLSELSQS